MKRVHDLTFRAVSAPDVPAMTRCRQGEPAGGPVDPRMSAYFEGLHHPQESLSPRTGFAAFDGDQVIGYIAGHRTKRHDCEGEVQYLFVAPAHRRRGIAGELLSLLADWFGAQGARQVCIAVAADSPPECKPFVEELGARPLRRHWHAWDDIGAVRGRVDGS